MSQPRLDDGVGLWPHRRARTAPEDIAIIDRDRRVTVGALADRVEHLAGGLRERGIGHGDRVAFLGPNSSAFIETFFATLRIGAIFVPLNTRLAAPELVFMLEDAAAALLIWDPAFADTVAAVLDQVEVASCPTRAGERAGGPDLDEVAAVGSTPLAPTSVVHDDVAMIMYTSGTTGHPKGAMITHGNLAWNTFNKLIDVDIQHGEVTLVAAPLFHTAALNQMFLPTFIKGGTVVLASRFDPDDALRTIEREQVTFTFGVPAMVRALVQSDAWRTTDLSSLRFIEVGGAPVPFDLIESVQARDVVILQGYGLTEASPGVLFLRAEDSRRKAGSAGTPCFFCDVEIMRDGTPVSTGEPGEIWVQGPNVTAGYWGRNDATAEAITEDGWLRTGDIGIRDEDGFITIIDRAKDMIISGGENVYPAEVEQAIHAHPDVLDCAVVGVPDKRWGEVGCAVLVTEGGRPLPVEDLRAFLDGRLARYKMPHHVRVVEQLPRGGSGKVLKHHLRDLVQEPKNSEHAGS